MHCCSEPESSQSSVKRARHSPPDTQLTAAAASHVQQNNTVSTSGEQQVVQPTPATTRIHPRPSAVYRDFMTADDPTSTPMFERVERAVEEEMGSVDEEPYLKGKCELFICIHTSSYYSGRCRVA
jgi:hypothetical protein